MMSVTLELSPEQEAKLRAYIARRDSEGMSQLLLEVFLPTVSALLEPDDDSMAENEFEATADRFADVFATCFASEPPVLSDYATSRAGIYEDRL
ncbi:hypothetical protein [Roseofilum casamattae]|uniref:Uncharacterized protein n=1 Tax=Roseofilum casamattae BLCC-M143 TaxID=3022442 RepID=A0ABT7BSC3_9CYAN|nr:hypothetical protein [Roseofilum casamattae]MDJ1182081.1 hypothetical protein [Roseofilum casamattae BLCC-M143]